MAFLKRSGYVKLSSLILKFHIISIIISKNNNLSMRSCILLVFLLFIMAQNRVIQVTTNNVQLILRSLGSLHLLLHNPKCQHSKEYSQNFLRINNTNINLGMADCSVQASLCHHLNATRHPTLMIVSNHSLEIIDQDLFLYEQNVLQLDDPRVALKNILTILKKGDQHATIVLQQQELPILDKIQNSHQKNVFYIKNPSRLHSTLYNFMGKQLGCWIVSYKENQIQKHFCGTGYRSDELQKYLDSFNKGKLERHIFTKQTNNTYLHSSQLKQIVADLGRKTQRCKFVYFYSKQCEHCSIRDFKKVKSVINQARIAVDYQIQIFDMDNEEFPKELPLPRVPELIYFCYSHSFYFGDIFTYQNIRKFLVNQRNPSDKKKQQIKNKQQDQEQQKDQQYYWQVKEAQL